MGSGVAVGGTGVRVAVGVETGVGVGREAHAASPSTVNEVKSIRMKGRWENIVPDYTLKT
jgi:hypothetical protein